MKKQINFGTYKINGYKTPKTILVDIELKDKGDGKLALSICGQIGLGYSCISGGQNLDHIAEYIKGNALFDKLYRWWTLYHLNDMVAECEHQLELGWDKLASKQVNIYHFTMKSNIMDMKRQFEAQVISNAVKGIDARLTDTARKIMGLPDYFINSYKNTLDADIAEYFTLDPKKTETKTLGWLYPTQHPDGLLTKKCPVCGYKRGTAWKFHAIPQNELDEMIKLLQGGTK